MLSVSSILQRECRWLGANLALALDVLFFVALIHGTVALALSSDGSVAAGWGGEPVRQVVGWGLGWVWMVGIVCSPLLLVVFGAYRLIVRVLGHPRFSAVATALGCVGLAVATIPNVQPGSIVEAGAAAVAYSLVARLPGQSLAELPQLVRGGIAGLALGFIWFIGSFAALGWAAFRASRGDWIEAGGLAVASTAVTGWLLFSDLFRDGVPDLNYLVTAILLGGFWVGLVILVGRPVRARWLVLTPGSAQ